MPPDRWAGLAFSNPLSPTSLTRSVTWERSRWRAISNGRPTLSTTERHGSSAESWNATPTWRSRRACRGNSPSTKTVPEVGWSRSATMRSKVDFPQPEGPRSATKPPRGTSKVKSSTASTSSPPGTVKRRVTSVKVMPLVCGSSEAVGTVVNLLENRHVEDRFVGREVASGQGVHVDLDAGVIHPEHSVGLGGRALHEGDLGKVLELLTVCTQPQRLAVVVGDQRDHIVGIGEVVLPAQDRGPQEVDQVRALVLQGVLGDEDTVVVDVVVVIGQQERAGFKSFLLQQKGICSDEGDRRVDRAVGDRGRIRAVTDDVDALGVDVVDGKKRGDLISRTGRYSQGFADQILRGVDVALLQGQNAQWVLLVLGADDHQRRTVVLRRGDGVSAAQAHLRTASGDNLFGSDTGATGGDRDVDLVLAVIAFGVSDEVAREFGVGDPCALQRQCCERAGVVLRCGTARGQQGGSADRHRSRTQEAEPGTVQELSSINQGHIPIGAVVSRWGETAPARGHSQVRRRGVSPHAMITGRSSPVREVNSGLP